MIDYFVENFTLELPPPHLLAAAGKTLVCNTERRKARREKRSKSYAVQVTKELITSKTCHSMSPYAPVRDRIIIKRNLL